MITKYSRNKWLAIWGVFAYLFKIHKNLTEFEISVKIKDHEYHFTLFKVVGGGWGRYEEE